MTDSEHSDGCRRDPAFEGYIKARLEDISRAQAEQRIEVGVLRTQVAELAISVGALKATARAWGVFAGFISGAITGLTSRFWGKL